MKRSTLVGSVAACICLGLSCSAARGRTRGKRRGEQPASRRAERHRRQARGEVSERSARLRQPDAEGRLLAGRRRLRLWLSDRWPWLRLRLSDRRPPGGAECGRVSGRATGLRGPDPRRLRQHSRPTRPTAAVRDGARHDPRYLQTLCGRYAQRRRADGERAGLAAAADRRRDRRSPARMPRSGPTSCSAPTCATRRTRLSAASMTS